MFCNPSEARKTVDKTRKRSNFKYYNDWELHQQRLNKYSKSTFKNTTFYVGSRGSVYYINSRGTKVYC
ncbi:hypothetical protein [Prochlorococcus marinus]|uniref:hypothetical protein n=1 Tax=Prochlorococcus marinus TaxID=1219 RepID=UPI000190048E|nr:hypothetical protein [Prochlorococcus marinus]EEE40847.1 conserved hypothetical protein [Prochlorococcus marinus str. MIT 9202]